MHINDNVSDIMKEVEKELSAVAKEILEPELDEDSKQGAVMVAGYIVKKKTSAHSKYSEHQHNLVDIESWIKHRNTVLNRNNNSVFLFLKIH